MPDNTDNRDKRLLNLTANMFKPGESGNPAGRPRGAVNLSTRIKNLLEGHTALPKNIADTIKNAVGEDKKALDALLIVALLQGLQGEVRSTELLLDRGYGKAPPTDPEDEPKPTEIVVTYVDGNKKPDGDK